MGENVDLSKFAATITNSYFIVADTASGDEAEQSEEEKERVP
jgi:hypothetical protein